MRSTPEIDARTGLEKLATYPFQIATWVDETGYPVSVAVDVRIDPAAGTARFAAPAGLDDPDPSRHLADGVAYPAPAGLWL